MNNKIEELVEDTKNECEENITPEFAIPLVFVNDHRDAIKKLDDLMEMVNSRFFNEGDTQSKEEEEIEESARQAILYFESLINSSSYRLDLDYIIKHTKCNKSSSN